MSDGAMMKELLELAAGESVAARGTTGPARVRTVGKWVFVLQLWPHLAARVKRRTE